MYILSFLVLSSSALALGLYGNDDAHNGISRMIKSVQSVDEFLQNVQAETRVAELMLRGEITSNVRELANEFDREIVSLLKTLTTFLLLLCIKYSIGMF